jgi:hypothetical protein
MKFFTAVLWSVILEQPLADHVVNRLVGQIRIDGAAAVADEQAK